MTRHTCRYHRHPSVYACSARTDGAKAMAGGSSPAKVCVSPMAIPSCCTIRVIVIIMTLAMLLVLYAEPGVPGGAVWGTDVLGFLQQGTLTPRARSSREEHAELEGPSLAASSNARVQPCVAARRSLVRASPLLSRAVPLLYMFVRTAYKSGERDVPQLYGFVSRQTKRPGRVRYRVATRVFSTVNTQPVPKTDNTTVAVSFVVRSIKSSLPPGRAVVLVRQDL